MTVARQLAGSRVFAGLGSEVTDCAHLWRPRQLESGEPLWWQGQPANELAVLVHGEVRVRIEAMELGRVSAGELLGEAAVWFRERRTATVSAIGRCELLVIRADQLGTLRSMHPRIYDHLLDQALRAVAWRVHAVDRRIAKLAEGTEEVPERVQQSSLGRLVERISEAVSVGRRPSAVEVLRRLPLLDKAPEQILKEIDGVLQLRRRAEGRPVFIESDPGSSVFILAAGKVDVLRNVGGQRAARLAFLEPTAMFGTGSLILGERRNASCVAREDTVLYELDGDALSSLSSETGRCVRLAILAALRLQIAGADAELARLKHGGEPIRLSDYDRIRGQLAGYQGDRKLTFEDPWNARKRGGEGELWPV